MKASVLLIILLFSSLLGFGQVWQWVKAYPPNAAYDIPSSITSSGDMALISGNTYSYPSEASTDFITKGYIHKIGPDGNLYSSILTDQRISTAINTGFGIVAGGEGILLFSSDLHLIAHKHPQLFFNSLSLIGDSIVGTGFFTGEIVMHGQEYSSNGGKDGFIAKMSIDGIITHFSIFGGESDEEGKVIKVLDGNIYFGGNHKSSFMINDVKADYMLSQNEWGNRLPDAFIAKATSDAEIEWITTINGLSQELLLDLEVSSQHGIYATGSFGSNAEAGNLHLQCKGVYDGFLLKLDHDGKVNNAMVIGGPSEDMLTGITSDHNSIYLTGFFKEKLEIGGTTFTSSFSDMFIASYSHDMELSWIQTSGSTDYACGRRLTKMGNNLIFTGDYAGSCDFGGFTLENPGFSKTMAGKMNLVTSSGNDQRQPDNLLVFPNPAKEKVYLKGSLKDISGNLEVYDSQGKQLYPTVYDEGYNIGIELTGHIGPAFIRWKKGNKYYLQRVIFNTEK